MTTVRRTNTILAHTHTRGRGSCARHAPPVRELWRRRIVGAVALRATLPVFDVAGRGGGNFVRIWRRPSPSGRPAGAKIFSNWFGGARSANMRDGCALARTRTGRNFMPCGFSSNAPSYHTSPRRDQKTPGCRRRRPNLSHNDRTTARP